MSEPEPSSLLGRDDLENAIRELTDVDWLRLKKVATMYSRGSPLESNDLLQEAFKRAVNGTRKCPAHVDVVRFLAEAMRSIADGEQEKYDKRPILVAIANHGTTNAVDPTDSAPNPEQVLMQTQDAVALKENVMAVFAGDEIAQIIVEGLMEGMTGNELRQLTELDKTAYETKRKLIRRRLDKKFPEGYKP